LRSDARPDETDKPSCNLEYVPVGLAAATRRLLRPAFIAELLLFSDVGQHLAQPLVLDNCRLVDFLQLVEGAVR
jgi:hypothetical protein